MNHNSNSHILIVDDEQDIRELLAEIFEDEGYRATRAAHSEEALHILKKDAPHLIILDIWLENSDMDGMEILAHVKQYYPEIPVLMISGHGNIEMAVKAMKFGAYEFIEKPFNSDHLLMLIQRALETNKLRSENQDLKQKIDVFGSFTATDPASIAIKNQVEKIAPTQSRVIVTGSSGSGKNLLTHFIHQQSNNASGPFVTLESVIVSSDSEEKQKERLSTAFAEAKGGTLVLQNVHELSTLAQSVLVQFLQDNDVSKSVRILSTTDENIIQHKIKTKQFKEDLFYRLNIAHIKIPSLSQRKQDISELAQSFLNKYFDEKGRKAPQFSDEALMLFMRYSWPGNVRQLKNIIENIAMQTLSQDDVSLITVAHVPSEIKKDLSNSADEANTDAEHTMLMQWLSLPMKDARSCFEKYYLDFQLERFSGQISKVAEFIEMDRTALHRKLKSLEDFDTGFTERENELKSKKTA
jgi:two-component system nitrogen regulation response regulator NtrX